MITDQPKHLYTLDKYGCSMSDLDTQQANLMDVTGDRDSFFRHNIAMHPRRAGDKTLEFYIQASIACENVPPRQYIYIALDGVNPSKPLTRYAYDRLMSTFRDMIIGMYSDVGLFDPAILNEPMTMP